MEENKDLTIYKTSQEIQKAVRENLVPQALDTYGILLLDEDPKVRQKAADSVMDIAGATSKSSNGGGNVGVVFNFDKDFLKGLGDGLTKLVGDVDNMKDVTNNG